MENITQEQVKNAINAFLTSQYDKKTDKEQKQLLKAREDKDVEKIAALNDILQSTKNKYELDTWMEYAATRLAKQISFGTHISKGVHSSSKGDNVNFSPKKELKGGLVGHQHLSDVPLDASGNAAALPVAGFFEFPVSDDGAVKIKDLIASDMEYIKSSLSKDVETSRTYYNGFRQSLLGSDTDVKNCGSNKQLLWPLSSSLNDDYVSITPLYPITLSHELYSIITEAKFSIRDKRQEKKKYITYPNLGLLMIGGTNPQGVSRLMKKQNGRNYLLPSLPPKFKQTRSFKIPVYSNTIFNKNLEYRCRDTFKALVRLIKTDYNNVNIRSARQAILDDLLYQVLAIASTIQQTETPGWTLDYALEYSEKLWLDPMRGELEGQEQFLSDRETTEWRKDISKHFANWVNGRLREEIKSAKHEFADAESKEWQKEMDDMIAQSQRQGQGVFL